MDSNDSDIQPGRNESFGQGIMAGVDPVHGSPFLQAEGERFNASVPREYKPTGSGDGMAADQDTATMGGMLPVANGSAADTWDTKKWFNNAQGGE